MAQITLNSTGVASNGALVLQSNGTTTAVTINASQGVEVIAGTAALPAITTTGDTNTGIFFPAADTIAFTEGGVEAMRINSSGNLGLGVTPSAWTSFSALQFGETGCIASNAFSSANTQTFFSNNVFYDGAYKYIASGSAAAQLIQVGNEHRWNIAPSGTAGNTISFTQAMTLDSSSRLLVGTTSTDPAFNRSNGVVLIDGTILLRNSGAGSDFGMSTSSGTNITFYTDNGSARVTAGAITSNGATTAYGLGSDYRMKTNVQPMIGALAKVLKLNPVTFIWKKEFAGTNPNGQGFIAHELQEFYSDAVVGEKDAVNKDGSIKPQNVDTSFLVATLTAAMQEQQALITALTARLDAANL